MQQKIILSSLFFLALGCATSAQVSTIQVTVSDTIMVPANHLNVVVSFKDTAGMDFPATFRDAEPEDADAPANPFNPYARMKSDFSADREAVIQLLDEKKVRWKSASEQFGFLKNPMGFGGANQSEKKQEEIAIDFASKAQMDEILTEIRKNPFVQTMETGTSVDAGSVDKTKLYEKLLSQAHEKATQIAKLAGKKVGAVYQIGTLTDPASPENYLDTLSKSGGIFGGLFSMLGGMMGPKSPEYKVSISESLSVTYLMQ